MRDYRQFEWRTGRKLVRTIYAVTGDDWEQHPLIGVMDTGDLAVEAVQAHNLTVPTRTRSPKP